MRLRYSVTGDSPAALQTAADSVAAEFAGDAAVTVEIGEVYADMWDNDAGRELDRPKGFRAEVTATVKGAPGKAKAAAT